MSTDQPPKQPRCPACESPDLRIEDVASGRAQCQRCRWRCVIEPSGTTRDWLNLGRNRTALQPIPDRSLEPETSCLNTELSSLDPDFDSTPLPPLDLNQLLADPAKMREAVRQFGRGFGDLPNGPKNAAAVLDGMSDAELDELLGRTFSNHGPQPSGESIA